MPLILLVIVVVLGIALVVAAIHFTAPRRKQAAADGESWRRRFQEDYPDEKSGEIIMTATGSTAFLPLENGRTGIVHAFGDRQITRILAPDDVAGIRRESDTRMTILVRDFTWRGATFDFDAGADAEKILARLQRPEFGNEARAD